MLCYVDRFVQQGFGERFHCVVFLKIWARDHLRQALRQALTELQAQLSIPMILITHHDEDVRWFGDDIIHLSEGKVVTQND